MALERAKLDVWDIITIVAYFTIVMAVGLISSWRAQRGSSAGFFLAGRTMTWLPIAASIFATNMGAPTLVGLTGSGAAMGVAPIMYEWHATYMLVLLGWIFVPIYIASGTFTIPGYLQLRYGGKRLRIYFALTQIVLTILVGISAEIYAGAVFLTQILGWNMYLSTILILVITAIYTVAGGLTAVIYTDALQTGILILGTTVLSVLSLQKVGGYDALVEQFPRAVSNQTYWTHTLYQNLSCGYPPHDAFHIFRSPSSNYPWPGFVFGLTLKACYYFCANQTIVQRNLSAKNLTHSKAACVAAAYLKLLPFILFMVPGMISRVLFPDEVACADPERCYEICEHRSGCSDLAFPLLVLRVLPTGIRGLTLAALLAALMSSLTSHINSLSSMFSMDIWRNIRKRPSDKELVLVGRLFGVALVGCSIGWLPILQRIKGSQLWDYLQSITSYVTPPWIVIVVMGMLWKRTTEQGAWWGLMAGLATGIIRLGIHCSYPTPNCGDTTEDTRPDILTKVHYLHFAIILGLVGFIVCLLVTLVTKPRPPEKLHRVTWWTRKEPLQPELSAEQEKIEEGEANEEYIVALTQLDDVNKEKDIAEEDAQTTVAEPSRCMRIYNTLCGFNKLETRLTEQQIAERRSHVTDISEDKFWSRVCNINAVIAIAVTSFLLGYLA